MVDFSDRFAHADPEVTATIELNTKIVVLIGTICSASVLAAVR